MLIPQKNNAFAWLNLLLLIAFVIIGKVSALAVLYGYFLETIIIGIFNVFKMVQCFKHDRERNKSIVFLVPFFIFHYGFFIAVQSIFLFVIVSMSGDQNITEPFHLMTNYKMVFQTEGILEIVFILGMSQILKYIFDFIQPQKYLAFSASEIMMKPYARIFIQQFVVILGSFFIVFSEASVVAALLLIIFRFLLDSFFVSIKSNAKLLEVVVDKLYDGKTPKAEIRKQLLLRSE
jgi:hypothetical protein